MSEFKDTFSKDIFDKYKKFDLDKNIPCEELLNAILNIPLDMSFEKQYHSLNQDYQLIIKIKKILKNNTFIMTATNEQLFQLNNLMDLLITVQEKEVDELPKNVQLDSIEVSKLTNNQTRRQLSFDYTRENTIPKNWLNVKHLQRKPVIIISTEENGDKVKEQLENLIENEDIKNINFRIEEIKPTRYAAIIKLFDISDVKKAQEYFQKKEPTWTVKIPEVIQPLMLVKKVRVEQKNQQTWLQRVMILNRFKMTEDVKVISTVKKDHSYNLVIQVTPEIRSQIQDRYGVIFSPTHRLEIVDYFNIPICTKCVRPGHKDDKCQKMVRKCAYGCLQSHEWQESCPRANDKAKQRCPNCYTNGHSAFDKQCPKWQEKLEIEISKRNFSYEWIIM